MLGTVLNVVSIVLTASLIVFLYIFKRGLPDFQQIFDNLGGEISSAFSDIVSQPVVKASMSQLGKKSGEVRASAALRRRVAAKAVGQNPLIAKALEYLELTPEEGLSLINDPTLGPVIQNMIGGVQKGIGKGFGGFGGDSRRPQQKSSSYNGNVFRVA